MRNKGDVLLSIFFILLGIFFIIRSIGLRVGTFAHPYSGFLPFWGGIIFIFFNLILLIRALGERHIKIQASGSLWRPTILIMGMLVYVVFLDILGYILVSIFLSVTILKVMETKTWWVVTVVSLLIATTSYIIFDRLLGVTLPKGILEGVL